MRASSTTLKDPLLPQLPLAGRGSSKPSLFPQAQAGLVLLDRTLRPISFNAAAIQILTFPEPPKNGRATGAILSEKIRSLTLASGGSSEVRFAPECISGARRYICKSFVVDIRRPDSSPAFVALLLERNSFSRLSVSQIAEQFKLTGREQQTVELLVEGLTTKEVANRLKISPNTVKTFLHLVMIKMGVSTRSGIVGKIANPQSIAP
jgi:DNA-binding NarL/FixJ family response regulator